MNEIEETKIIKRNRNLSTKQVGKELVILGGEETKIYALNESGRRIWELADGKKQLRQIIQQVALEYSVSFEQAKKDIFDFLNEANRQCDIFYFFDSPIKT
jgi:hypothetical protein